MEKKRSEPWLMTAHVVRRKPWKKKRKVKKQSVLIVEFRDDKFEKVLQ